MEASSGEEGRTSSYETIVKQHDGFQAYYASLGFLTDAKDVEQFMAALRRPLPTTFRITGTRRLVWFLIDRKVSCEMKGVL
jgi:hypothetical protein